VQQGDLIFTLADRRDATGMRHGTIENGFIERGDNFGMSEDNVRGNATAPRSGYKDGEH
jgi:hypothetical protein